MRQSLPGRYLKGMAPIRPNGVVEPCIPTRPQADGRDPVHPALAVPVFKYSRADVYNTFG
jgi:hypothetical protein